MANAELLNSLNALSRRINKLLQQNMNLQKQLMELENSNKELRKMHEEDMALLENAQKQIEFLSLSHRLANSPEALVEARNKISQLIRTIDSCIRLLKQD